MDISCRQKAAAGLSDALPGATVAEIFRDHGEAFWQQHPLTPAQAKAIRGIKLCRTPALGGRGIQCDHCGEEHVVWNSCNNPHCPTCGSMKRAGWLDARRADLLPVGYFHIVFTLDHAILPLIVRNPEAAYGALFSAAVDTLKSFASRLGGILGVTAVLHTWDQKLNRHPHIHCLVPGGMLSADHGRWIPFKKRFIFPVKALSKVFRARFLDQLDGLLNRGVIPLPDYLTVEDAQSVLVESRRRSWVVFAQPPMGGPDSVLQYLARYAYRVAISDQRIVGVDVGAVSFTYKDRKNDNAIRSETIDADEFIRRFLLHVLKPGFRRIRHFGFLANSNRGRLLARCFELLDRVPPGPRTKKNVRALMLELTGKDIALCSVCGVGTMCAKRLIQPSARPSAVVTNPFLSEVNDTS
jgi:hypothetical protein